MLVDSIDILATFLAPQNIGTNPQVFLWLFPLVAAIAVIYKAVKLPEISAGNFIKETITLFGSIVVFILVTALVLGVLAYFILG